MKFASEYKAELAIKSREMQLLEVELAAMRQRAEEAEQQRDGYKKACNDVIGEMLAKDEQDRIGHHIAGLLSYTMIVQGLPPKMANAQALREAVEAWREARKNVNPDDISTVQSCRSDRDAAVARAERAEEALRDLLSYPETPSLDERGLNAWREARNKARAVLSSPPADASIMVGERDNRTYNQLTPSEQFRLDKVERAKRRTGVRLLEDD